MPIVNCAEADEGGEEPPIRLGDSRTHQVARAPETHFKFIQRSE